jgi:hypothetical protein
MIGQDTRKFVRGMAAIAVGAFTLLVAQHASAQVDNSNSTVSCNTITKAVFKPKPALTTAGGLGATVIQVSGVLSGCTTNAPGVTIPDFKSKFKGVINSADNGCAGLAGPSPSTGTITITWKTNIAVTNKTSIVTIPAGGSAGGFLPVAGGTRGAFDLGTGAPSGSVVPGPTSALEVSGGFTGGTGGANSGAAVVTSEDIAVILAECGDIKGVKSINLGAGALSLQ